MTYQESLDYLYGLQTFGIKLGLENIRTFLSRLDHPEAGYRTILVAGTNGKGSIAATLAEILTRSGRRTGLYTSPHLHSFRERVRVNGVMIPEERVAELVSTLRPRAGAIPLTFFEFTTALALQYFADENVEAAVLEVGLGGRLDATNATGPALGVIAPVARDHERHLGATLDRIAREKAGIMRPGVPVVLSRQEPVAHQALGEAATAVGAAVVGCPDDYDWVDQGATFDYCGIDLVLPGLTPGLPGRHQFGNMATALAAAEMLRRQGLAVTPQAMRDGIEKVVWPGRLEWMCDRRVLLDGAHNGAGAAVLARYLADQGIADVHWIVGMKADKNKEEILAPLAARAVAAYCVEPPVEEPLRRDALQAAAVAAGLAAESFASLADALGRARAAAGETGVVLVAGSLFLVAAVREMLLMEEQCRCGDAAS